MTFFEVSPLCNFNVIESFTELSRIVLMRHGMEKIWRPNRGEARVGPAIRRKKKNCFKKEKVANKLVKGYLETE